MYAISFALASLLATIVTGLGIPGLPKCAGTCVGGFGKCGNLDVKCICSDHSLIANLACCVSTACDEADQKATIKFADSLCAGQGITNLPSSATCAATASSTSRVTPAPDGSSSTTGLVPLSSSTSSAVSSASSAASGAKSNVNSVSSSGAMAAQSSTSKVLSKSTAAASASATGSGGAGSDRLDGVGIGLVVAGFIAAL